MSFDTISVGSIVRAQRRPPTNSKCGKPTAMRALVATINEEDATLSILWEDAAPVPLTGSPPFLVAPTFKRRSSKQSNGSDGQKEGEGAEEEEVALSSLSALLPFETMEASHDDSVGKDSTKARMYKEQGDDLLRLRDPTSAIARYEASLSQTSSLSIGSTVIVNVNGYPTLADVDCIDDDDGTVDVTYVTQDDNAEQECTLPKGKILLSVLQHDEERLQERILLNLARCLHMLSEIDVERDSMRPSVYLKRAVLACSLALSCAANHDKNGDGDAPKSNAAKARYLRARAYVELHKFKHATADLRHILSRDQENRAGLQLLEEIKRREKWKKKTDKKLAKEMCSWVQHATSVNEGWVSEDDAEQTKERDSVMISSRAGAQPPSHDRNDDDSQRQTNLASTLFLIAVALVAPLLLAGFWQAILAPAQ